ncbi:MAG: class I SAM-dependent methyltransferase [Candidatus Thorarchaeota archaeon]
MSKEDEPHRHVDERTSIPFTARLMAYYRVQESKRPDAIIVDRYAELLVGDLGDYIEQHKRIAGTGDYAIVRSSYIESQLLDPWCFGYDQSQIVILGAGFDTRAYRIESLKQNSHSIYEIDFPIINRHKERILKGFKPLCQLVRIAADVSNKDWTITLIESGFNPNIPTFWILEGLVYYLQKKDASQLFRQLSDLSTESSEMFADVCVPAIADIQFGPFAPHFEWGIDIEEIPPFFKSLGWDVSLSYADDHDQGRDVGQKGMIFVHGSPTRSEVFERQPEQLFHVDYPDPRTLSKDIFSDVVRNIEMIAKEFQNDPESGLQYYVEYINKVKTQIAHIASVIDYPLSLGHISPRLLGNPLSILTEKSERSLVEVEAYIVGYLSAILLLVYLVSNDMDSFQFRQSRLYNERVQIQKSGKFTSLLHLISLLSP